MSFLHYLRKEFCAQLKGRSGFFNCTLTIEFRMMSYFNNIFQSLQNMCFIFIFIFIFVLRVHLTACHLTFMFFFSIRISN